MRLLQISTYYMYMLNTADRQTISKLDNVHGENNFMYTSNVQVIPSAKCSEI